MIRTVGELQEFLGVVRDDIWGPKSQAALDAVFRKTIWTKGKASSFADPADVAAFRKCKAEGKSDTACFAVGDNGIGCWGDDTARPTPMCALPPDDMIAKFGSVQAARHAVVLVRVNGVQVSCILADRMPWKKNIKNGAVIDLNPEAWRILGFRPPQMRAAQWSWA